MNRHLLLLWVAVSACGTSVADLEDVPPNEAESAAGELGAIVPGLRGSPTTLDIAQWNVLWLGNEQQGPSDEALQLARVSEVLRSANVELWALQEVSSQPAFERLVASLPGMGGISATDPSIADGTRFYRSDEQRPALIFKRRAVTVSDARLILTSAQQDFAGRPPLQVTLEVNINRQVTPLTVIVVHLKASSGVEDKARRARSAVALAQHLSTLRGSVLIIGDWNDGLTRSISGGLSPFPEFEGAEWLTLGLEQRGEASSVFGSFIDHALVTKDLVDRHRSTTVHDLRSARPDARTTTSDHFPVLHVFTP